MEITRRTGFRGVLLDLDDTICDSSPLWEVAFWNFAREMSEVTGGDPADIRYYLSHTNSELYGIFGVHPRKYQVIARLVANHFGCQERSAREWMWQVMRTIYLSVPEQYTETPEVLAEFEAADWVLGVGTHSPPGRTKRIVKAHGWKFPVVSQSTRGPKDKQVWIAAAGQAGVALPKAVVCGDSLSGDIMAGIEAGAGLTVWKKPVWSRFNDGEVPENQIIISEIGELAQALITHFRV